MTNLIQGLWKYIYGVYHPDTYHGYKKHGPFFEGWYYKLLDSKGTQKWLIIPGVYIGAEPEVSHCFIQIMNGADARSHYLSFPIAQFKSDEKRFHIAIGENTFSARQIHLEIHDEELIISGDLLFNHLSPWPVTLLSPRIMGWYAITGLFRLTMK